jgi:hypothetical protein
VREGARVVPRSKQPMRSQAAEETRGPQSGAHRRGKVPRQESCPDPMAMNHECTAFTFAIRGKLVV